MSQFSTRLQAALRRLHLSRADLSREVRSVTPPQLSRWIKGTSMPELSNLEAICRFLPAVDGDDVQVGYLLDHVVPSKAGRIAVSASEPPPSIHENPFQEVPPSGSILKLSLDALGDLAMRDERVERLALELVRYLMPPDWSQVREQWLAAMQDPNRETMHYPDEEKDDIMVDPPRPTPPVPPER